MKSRNVIEAIQHSNMTKERLINVINKSSQTKKFVDTDQLHK